MIQSSFSALVLLLVLSASSLYAGGAVRWFPANGKLHRNGMIILLFDEDGRELANQVRASRVVLTRAQSNEEVPLLPLELLQVEDLEGQALAFLPSRELEARTSYFFQVQDPELPVRQTFRTLAGRAPRLSGEAPRFRSLPGKELRFTCAELRQAGWVRVEVERSTGVGEEDPDSDLYEAGWERLGSYVLHPVWRQGPDAFVDLARALGIPQSPFRVRFTLIGRDGFVGRPSGWRILPGRSSAQL